MSQVKAGKLRALGVTGTTRLASLPDVPTIAETLPGYEAVSWGGVMAPAGTPPEVIKRLNTEINRILKMPEVSEKLESLGAIIVGSTPEEFGAYVKSEIEKWGKVARENNVSLD
jgi:tripartite-type tricarboxylate transporter receptor subunit TctC